MNDTNTPPPATAPFRIGPDWTTVRFDASDLYEVEFVADELAGGVPKNPELIKSWLASMNKEWSDAQREAVAEATVEQMAAASEELATKGWNGFKSDPERGLYVEGRCLKAMIKEAASIIAPFVPNGAQPPRGRKKAAESPYGITRFKSKVADQVFVREDRVYVNKTEPDGTLERPIHVMTAQGERTSIKRTDILRDVVVRFTVTRLANGDVPEIALAAVLAYAMQVGFGADRSQGFGVGRNLRIRKTKAADFTMTATPAP